MATKQYIFRAIILVVISISPFLVSSQINYRINWEDEFSKSEKEEIEEWLKGVERAKSDLIGVYPFQIVFYLHKSERGNEPVPWANTSRSGEEAVHFYVNTNFPLLEFQQDWTAAHEISHLSMPFIGRKNMWFSEGYASYMQWYILANQGIYSTQEINAKYRLKLQKAVSKLNSDETFVRYCGELLAKHDYPSVYWGGASYFFQANKVLQEEHDISLFDVIKRYQNDGRKEDENLNDLISSLDRISESNVFSNLLENFMSKSSREALAPTPIPD